MSSIGTGVGWVPPGVYAIESLGRGVLGCWEGGIFLYSVFGWVFLGPLGPCCVGSLVFLGPFYIGSLPVLGPFRLWVVVCSVFGFVGG